MEKQANKNVFSERLVDYRSVENKKLKLSLSITILVMIIQIIGGYLTNSIALISDALHMFTHSFAIVISLIAIYIAKKPPCHHRTFGLYRAEILAMFINGLFLILVVGLIIYEAFQRIINPIEVYSLQMLMIAFIGLAVNLTSIFILHGSHKKSIIRGVFYHMIADAISSIGIVFAAVIIFFTGWNIIDPIVSIFISAIIIYWAWGLLKESTKVLLEMAPTGLNIDIICDDLKTNFPEIKELSKVHIWVITPEMLVFSAHITLKDTNMLSTNQDKLSSRINKHLSEKYNIVESTIQISFCP